MNNLGIHGTAIQGANWMACCSRIHPADVLLAAEPRTCMSWTFLQVADRCNGV